MQKLSFIGWNPLTVCITHWIVDYCFEASSLAVVMRVFWTQKWPYSHTLKHIVYVTLNGTIHYNMTIVLYWRLGASIWDHKLIGKMFTERIKNTSSEKKGHFIISWQSISTTMTRLPFATSGIAPLLAVRKMSTVKPQDRKCCPPANRLTDI